MARLSLQEINEITLPEQEVRVPEWGGEVLVRAITSAELARAERQATNKRTGTVDNVQLTAMIIEAGCKDPQFAPGQYTLLMKKPIGPLNRISSVILALSGIDPDEDTEAEEKN